MPDLKIERGLREMCAMLGPKYHPEIIDREYVANINFGNGYDVEVSGVNHNFTTYRALKAAVFVWLDKSQIVEQHLCIKSIDELKTLLKDIESRYSSLPHP